jgi:hypothetical protein
VGNDIYLSSWFVSRWLGVLTLQNAEASLAKGIRGVELKGIPLLLQPNLNLLLKTTGTLGSLVKLI